MDDKTKDDKTIDDKTIDDKTKDDKIIVHANTEKEKEIVKTILDLIVIRHDTEVIKLIELNPHLLNTKIDFVNYGPDCTDFTILEEACCKGSPEIISFLLNKQPDMLFSQNEGPRASFTYNKDGSICKLPRNTIFNTLQYRLQAKHLPIVLPDDDYKIELILSSLQAEESTKHQPKNLKLSD
jgi:hypothetical protein